MGKKVFLIDVDYCNGCHNCQVACKDEHCGASWLPYAQVQPMTGQFWCKVEEKVRGSVPKVKISYIPHMDAQDDAVATMAGDCLMQREDGLVVIDPAKASGRKDLADLEGVFWNAGLEIPQGCTGCAHLLDDGWTVPRCVDACATGALKFGDEEEFADQLKDATRLTPGSHVYYLNYPKRFIAGEIYDEDEDEVLIGFSVELLREGSVVATTESDEFGDWWFKQVEAGRYQVRFVTPEGYYERTIDVDATDEDVNIGSIPLYKQIALDSYSLDDKIAADK